MCVCVCVYLYIFMLSLLFTGTRCARRHVPLALGAQPVVVCGGVLVVSCVVWWCSCSCCGSVPCACVFVSPLYYKPSMFVRVTC